ncbi:uncharacterized protein LOC107778558 isoform X1 [Nicotiana tabacum]|uniref:Uncharacterized protein LOC107778558 isoform X1 n=1 Tax=Nicotiana tabacum TaxID=4097 RepID=A0A1S3YQB1_TOBAC|nr:PREDICTED: uncharacterized protein LOC107778558 isoform X1 [Nicotiana tabacum]
MSSLSNQVMRSCIKDHEASAMELGRRQKSEVEEEEEEEDPFLQFIEYAKSVLSPDEAKGPSWSWIAYKILKTCIAYSSGVTSAILLSDLFQAWNELNRSGVPKKQSECISHMKKKHKRAKLPNTVTIDSIYEKKFLSLNSVIEAVIIDTFVLPGTNIYMLHLGDFWSSNTIDLYLHRRFYSLADPKNGILKKGREVFLTGCRLRTATGCSGHARLLPTEYLVILLDEDQDDDAMLLLARFCADSFSSISLGTVNQGVSYSLRARIESITSPEVQGKYGSLQRKQINLVDFDGVTSKFLLWGEQVLLANVFSVGSTLALDRPFILSSTESALELSEEFCLEYGTATQLYLVPFIRHEEQVSVTLTQNHHKGSKLSRAMDPSQGLVVSQVSLPCNSQGSIDFSNYPFRSFVIDLREKMTGVSLYGIVADIRSTQEPVFSVKIQDVTGAVWVRLHFDRSWSLGRLGLGHSIYISGLACSMGTRKSLELQWFENDGGASFINISCLPALLNSSFLHKLSCLSDLSVEPTGIRVCRVWLDQIEHCHVTTRLSHTSCGYFRDDSSIEDLKCSFCQCKCNAELAWSFHLKITLADESGKIFAWCTGQTAVELLQITPDEFCELPEEEQIMYPSSLEHETFKVALVNCRKKVEGLMDQDHDAVEWEITRAMKWE